jgi:prepilin-type N-terminal cleavage/methylation domain-containing protein
MKKPALMKKNSFGFTLIELIVVIGVLAVLFAITLVALNPARQFMQARDTQRSSDVKAILEAVDQFLVDQGQLPLGVDGTLKEIAAPAGAGSVDLCFQLVTRYIARLPVDPSVNNGTPIGPCTANYNTGYFIQASGSDDRVTVTAPNTEMTPLDPIQITR